MNKKGIFYAAGAYFLWGVLPIYWKLLHSVSSFQTLAHRVCWTFILLALVVALRGEGPRLKQAFGNRRTVLYLTLTAALLATNWIVYIWAVNNGHVVEASLGYFINPLVSVLLGVVFLRERLRPAQWGAVGLAAVGVGYLWRMYGAPPWIALALAFSFALYGLFKKFAPVESLHSFTIELAVMLLPALGYVVFVERQGMGAFGQGGWELRLLLMGTSVITAVPVLLFNSAAPLIPLSALGILLYINPTFQFLIGLTVFGEPFSTGQLVGFGMIWTALLGYWLEGTLRRKQAGARPAGEAPVN